MVTPGWNQGPGNKQNLAYPVIHGQIKFKISKYVAQSRRHLWLTLSLGSKWVTRPPYATNVLANMARAKEFHALEGLRERGATGRVLDWVAEKGKGDSLRACDYLTSQLYEDYDNSFARGKEWKGDQINDYKRPCFITRTEEGEEGHMPAKVHEELQMIKLVEREESNQFQTILIISFIICCFKCCLKNCFTLVA